MTLADLRVHSRQGVVYAALSGDVDMSVVHGIREELSAVTPNEALALVLDLTEVDYLDSAGIHMVHRLREGLHKRGQQLKLVIPPESMINDTLRLAGLDWDDDRAESLDAAQEALAPDQPPSPAAGHRVT